MKYSKEELLKALKLPLEKRIGHDGTILNCDGTHADLRFFLTEILLVLWEYGEDFDPKKPFDKKEDWQREIYIPLIKAGIIDGVLSYDFGCECIEFSRYTVSNYEQADEYIVSMISVMCGKEL